VVAVDVARMGADKSVLAVARGMRLDELVELPPGDLMKTTGRVITECDRIGVSPREQRVRMPWELAQSDGCYGQCTASLRVLPVFELESRGRP
jgi:hypothetical protein